MPKVNLELQLKFLNELEQALSDALKEYACDSPEKLAELKYMQHEVERAKRVIAERTSLKQKENRSYGLEDYREAAFV